MDSGTNPAIWGAFSRRSLLSFLASSPLILVSCRSLRPPSPSSDSLADEQLNRVVAGYNTLARNDRALPGIRSLAQINEQLTAGFSPADLSLLSSALYLRAREQVSGLGRAITVADLRSAFARPIDLAPYGRSFLEQTLTDARAREAVDPAYRRELQKRKRTREGCVNGDTGAPIPWWICVIVIVIIIVVIIIVLVDENSDLPEGSHAGARDALRG